MECHIENKKFRVYTTLTDGHIQWNLAVCLSDRLVEGGTCSSQTERSTLGANPLLVDLSRPSALRGKIAVIALRLISGTEGATAKRLQES